MHNTTRRRVRKGDAWMHIPDPDRLDRLRRMRHISVRDLAAAAGWSSPSYMHRVLAGTVTSVTPDAATRIAAYLEMPIDVLFVPRIATVGAHEHRQAVAA